MKGVKCILSRKFYIILVPFFVLLGTLFLKNNAYADSHQWFQNGEVNNLTIKYTSTCGQQQTPCVGTSTYNGRDVPFGILATGYLFGLVFFSQDISGYNYENTTRVYATVSLHGPSGFAGDWGVIMNTYNFVVTDTQGVGHTGTCGIDEQDYTYSVLHCNVLLTNNARPDHYALRWGNINDIDISTTFPMAQACPSGSGPQCGLRINYVAWGYRTTTSPESEKLDNVADILLEQQEQDQQDREDLQNNSEHASDSADDLGNDVDDAGEQLLYVLTNFYGLFLNPPSSDCTIDGDTGFMDLGDIDLCYLSPPPAVSILATLLLIGLVIPFAVSAISTLIKLLEGVYTT